MSFWWLNTSLSQDFMTTDMRAAGLWTLNPVMESCKKTRVIVERLKQGGVSRSSRDQLKIRVKMGTSSTA